MPTIEELPDDAPVGTSAGGVPQKPADFDRGGISEELAQKLVQQMQAGPDAAANSWLPGKSGKSFEDALKTFDSVPLFMKDLPDQSEADAESGGQDGGAIEALKSLAFDGTPDEVAENFKKHGNDYFKAKRYREAIGFYTQAIDSDPVGDALRLSLFLNRAACHLELKNYRQTLKDTSAALGLDPKSSKAFYRAAKALTALGKDVEAIDCCDHGLLIDANNIEMVRLKEKIVKDGVAREKRQREDKERQRRKDETEKALKKAFLARGLWIENSERPPDNPTPAHFDPDNLPAHSSLSYPLDAPTDKGKATPWQPPDIIRTPVVFPVMLLYPQYAQSDLITHYQEDTPVGAHLDAMFPQAGAVPWDARGEYVSAKLSVYASTKKMRLLKVGRGLGLREVIDQGATEERAMRDGVEVVVKRDGIVLRDGIIGLVVLPKGSDAEKTWIEKFKSDREAARAKGQLN